MAKLSKHIVNDLAKQAAFQYAFPPTLLLAMALQESGFDTEAVRLEQNFYRKYVRGVIDAPPLVQILLSCSYGLMQTMGESLYRMGFFRDVKDVTKVAEDIQRYLQSPGSQMEHGARWLSVKLKAVGSLDKAVIAYNGSPAYLEVIANHRRKLEQEGF